MRTAYVDTSVLVSMALREPEETEIARLLSQFGRVVASNLLEAELRSVCVRERIAPEEDLLSEFQWIEPNRPLTAEITRVLSAGYVRGTDCWHLASALFLAPDPAGFTFLTRDVRQREVAQALGFET